MSTFCRESTFPVEIFIPVECVLMVGLMVGLMPCNVIFLEIFSKEVRLICVTEELKVIRVFSVLQVTALLKVPGPSSAVDVTDLSLIHI